VPCSIRFLEPEQVVVVTAEPPTDFESSISAIESVARDPRFTAEHAILVDQPRTRHALGRDRQALQQASVTSSD
jgi:hypothetical protein